MLLNKLMNKQSLPELAGPGAIFWSNNLFILPLGRLGPRKTCDLAKVT